MGTDARFGPDAGVAAREVSTDEHLLRHPIPVTGSNRPLQRVRQVDRATVSPAGEKCRPHPLMDRPHKTAAELTGGRLAVHSRQNIRLSSDVTNPLSREFEISGRMGTDARFGPDAGVAAREVSTDEHLLRHPIPVTGSNRPLQRVRQVDRATVSPAGENADPTP